MAKDSDTHIQYIYIYIVIYGFTMLDSYYTHTDIYIYIQYISYQIGVLESLIIVDHVII